MRKAPEMPGHKGRAEMGLKMKIENFQSGDLRYASLRFALKFPGLGKEHGYKYDTDSKGGNSGK